ncbi:cell wall hydrolase [Erythrobacter sp. QSSC1-22B]|uniref:cell wall hydrolase n=1 Tax=Erythrobacter sp. QSSC1-22B TaxID=1860125 RepID=UPI001F1B10EF|nr:cell wall hydrolase [Erythrobacter sp. QSSC1-22B]
MQRKLKYMRVKRKVGRNVLLWTAVGLMTLSAAGAIFYSGWGRSGKLSSGRDTPIEELSPIAQLALPPGIEQLELLSEDEALAANKSLPYSDDPVEAASPFRQSADWTQAATYDSALECLSATIYYEANGEGAAGQRAVAQVVLNRVRHPAFPSSVCGVVYQGSHLRTGCQFTFTCDGSLLRTASAQGWSRAERIASEALKGKVEPSVGMATHYHANYVFPYWAPSLAKVATINTHIFYRWSGSWGRRRAFSQAYAGELVNSPSIETVPLLEGLEEAFLDTSVTSSAGDLPQSRPNRTSPLADVEAPSSVRADQRSGTLKLDEAPSELVVE